MTRANAVRALALAAAVTLWLPLLGLVDLVAPFFDHSTRGLRAIDPVFLEKQGAPGGRESGFQFQGLAQSPFRLLAASGIGQESAQPHEGLRGGCGLVQFEIFGQLVFDRQQVQLDASFGLGPEMGWELIQGLPCVGEAFALQSASL